MGFCYVFSPPSCLSPIAYSLTPRARPATLLVQSLTTAPAVVNNLFRAVEQTPAAQSLFRRLEQGEACVYGGVSLGAHPFLVALLRRRLPEVPIVFITEGLKSQERAQQDLETWLRLCREFETEEAGSRTQTGLRSSGQPPPEPAPPPPPLFYPAWDILPHEAKLPHVDVISERLQTLVSLADWAGLAPIVVTSVTALLQRTFSRNELSSRTRRLGRGMQMDPRALAEWLLAQGYEPEAQVNHKGEFSLRGGILDLFPPTAAWPARLEFFGDELDALRYFDPITQISRESIAEVVVSPAGELGLLKQRLNQPGPAAAASDDSDEPRLATLVDYLPPGTIWLLSEPEQLSGQAREYAKAIPPGDPFFVSWEDLQQAAREKGIVPLELSESSAGEGQNVSQDIYIECEEARFVVANDDPPADPTLDSQPSTLNSFSLPFTSLEVFRPIVDHAPELPVAEAQRREFFMQLQRWLRQGYTLHVCCNNEGERQRFGEIWKEYGFERAETAPELHLGTLSRGFLFDAGKLVVVTDAEIFGRYKIQRPRRLKSPHAQMTRSALQIDFADLQEGDYVVHVQHGIGRYAGLHALPVGGGAKPLEKAAAPIEGGQECLVIEYAPNDPTQPPPKLYVPVNEAHLVSKYIGAGKAHPPLNTLGGGRWAKTKEAAERAVRDLAGELLTIQAARESQPGHAFPPDAAWQREFESAFLFEETPDQVKAIRETKSDMEGVKPMDRLICGDVGFGKTEVAIRAAFKAVMGGKQVALLVPTTVLAQQHFNTFCERMADYPIRVELLSRFRSARAQKRVIQDLATGGVDIVIGTHRLIQSDVMFKDLGLVVIDEEQRFGVMHKEKFKLLRALVDVLTLSATPIPRTLYLALTGARDMSTIATPPQDRLPVETIVAQYDERVIRDAIQRELNRQGQVFYLHNRVFDIDAVRARLSALVPKARLVVGHGQMPAEELEDVMTRFVNGEADVLLSTTIIESGLDIPNANTIIIDRADRFGLSDLYQLRGRVGRYKHQAYAYLLLPRHAGLLSDARKRMSAIKQYSTLGSGFKIAMRDLEIRGAGNLLGSQQSGHITAVGFELYCQLLKQSVSALKGEKVKPRLEVPVRLDFLALTPAGPGVREEGGRRENGGERMDESGGNGQRPMANNSRRPTEDGELNSAAEAQANAAYFPLSYIPDSRQRVEMYRKLAAAAEAAEIERVRAELRDRFGPPPPPVELLLQVAGLKILAAARGVTSIESKDGKLILTRGGDFIMAGGKFPRLVKPSAKARLNEIKRLLQAL